VISRTPVAQAGIETFKTIDDALAACTGDVWFIGGARIYGEAMAHADVIDVTLVPDHVPHDLPGSVRFPEIDEARFEPGAAVAFEGDSRLKRCVYTRRSSSGG
jgi:dihydrofolate reductase